MHGRLGYVGDRIIVISCTNISSNIHAVLYARKRAKAWCFFSKRIKKYEKGLRPSRTVEDKHGCWKATGGEKKLKDKNGNLLGKKQTLTYNEGKKNSIKTNWIMQEFILTSDDKKFDDFALYKIYQRNTKIKATATSFQEGMGLTDNLPLQLPYNFPSLGTQQLGNDNHNQAEFNMPIMADTRSEFYHNSNININPPGQFDDINYSYPPPLSSSIAMFNDSTLISHQQAMTALLSPFEQAMAPFTNQEIGYI
ncbi:hypothetical protein Scep_022050 [Stephania cephalantha]|uniref:NAC domain-containing protein n=1 Tax=Stephania cephalantha TaxID=152367 RepID=A0AAP0F5N0_9MAGN